MAPAYRSLEDGQIVVSDEPRPDLEAIARWETIDEDEAREALAAAPLPPVDEDLDRLLAYLTEHDITPAVVLDILTAEPPADPPVDDDAQVAASGIAADGTQPVDDEASTIEPTPAEPIEQKPTRGRRKAGDA